MSYNGIDVSSYQGSVDWNKVSKQNVDFAILRASMGKASRALRFKANAAGALAAGLQAGAYHYSYATSVAQAHTEAKNLLAAVNGQKITYPLVLDYEYNSSTAKASDWTGIAIAFLQDLENAGYFAMLYSDKNSLQTRFDPQKLAPYAVWVAQWASTNTYPNPYGIWQYSDTGKVSGISTDVDLDVSKYDYASKIKNAGLNHL
jgi:lysozyme